jgi:hypothetical protein
VRRRQREQTLLTCDAHDTVFLFVSCKGIHRPP